MCLPETASAWHSGKSMGGFERAGREFISYKTETNTVQESVFIALTLFAIILCSVAVVALTLFAVIYSFVVAALLPC